MCSQEAVQEFPPQDSASLPLTRTLPRPGRALARAAPRSSREAQLTPGTPRGLPPFTRDFCLLPLEALQGEGTRRCGVPVPTPFSRVTHPGK